ncbi:MAG: hypothetical protein FD141_492 [Fusobacteria bacterium]|nr:MAG: hypothetical protein FD141_492 [Fusobacteriota bacterium]KAF0228843.1 MAG: hypothetical protein FD182_1099 [Fusobacteriota bacterium]
MNKKIYFIGSEDLRNYLERSLQLIGWKIEDFIGWNVDSLIIYQLEQVDIPSFHLPDNLLIVTNNKKLKDYNNTNIFYYQINNLRFTFSRFIIEYIQRQTNKPSDFYDSKEVINLLYTCQSSNLENLVTHINKNNRYEVRKLKYSNHLAEQPIKTIIYMEAPEKSIIITNLLTIYRGYTWIQKKELKGQNPLAPKLFINKIDKSTTNKILKLLN